MRTATVGRIAGCMSSQKPKAHQAATELPKKAELLYDVVKTLEPIRGDVTPVQLMDLVDMFKTVGGASVKGASSVLIKYLEARIKEVAGTNAGLAKTLEAQKVVATYF